MKISIVPMIIVLLLSGCLTSREHIIETDYSFKGRFNKYKTYSFMNNENTGGEDIHNVAIEKYISRRLKSMGYEYSERKPSLIISYKLYHSELQIKSYDQPGFENWLAENYSSDVIAPVSSDDESLDDDQYVEDSAQTENNIQSNPNNQGYSPFFKQIKEGALYISFIDRKEKSAVWQGFASGIMAEGKIYNERFISSTVGKILDEYRALAEGFDLSKIVN